ncbi:FGGY family carbohydrate kinase, partial [Rhizobium ruizarguesonis]
MLFQMPGAIPLRQNQLRSTRGSDESVSSIELTGQIPHVSAPSALLAWIREMETERYKRIGHFISCKDWLRFCLTGIIGTDR